MFNKNCSKYVIPCEYSVQTVQSKETSQIKYRLLLKSINDSRFPFTYKAAPYSGKPENGDGLYYTCAAEDYVKYLVNEIEKDTSLKGCNKSTDRLYTSVPPAKWLLDRNIATVGTLNTVRIGIPDELKNTKCRENFSVSFHIKSKEKNLYITTYSVKTKSTGRKNVLMLSAMRPIPRKTKDDGKSKPAIMKFYDFTKGGNKIVDQFGFFYKYKFTVENNNNKKRHSPDIQELEDAWDKLKNY